jgi:16S rRNA (cytosine967-C5)-methyltransferase
VKESARIETSIRLLGELEKTDQAVDRLLAQWARDNRYAGSKDRRAVQERVYAVLRHRGEVRFALSGAQSPRLEMFAALHLYEDLDVDAIAQLADGSEHGPLALTQEERECLDNLKALEGADAAAKANIPDWTVPLFEQAYGEAWPAQATALGEQASVDLRVNALKTSPDRVVKAMAESNIEVAALPHSEWALRAPARSAVSHTKAFNKGMCEVQDLGSQILCMLANATPGEQVIDLCAGAGGKSLAMGATMDNKGQIYALDIDARRLNRGRERVERAGIRNTQFHQLTKYNSTEERTLPELVDNMDMVFVDAPCSGSGAWRRHPDARWRLTPEQLATYNELQDQVLDRGARYVSPGSRMIYATCSLFTQENEDRVTAFLERHPEFSCVEWQDAWNEKLPPLDAVHGPGLRLSPADHGCDGFFAAVLVKSKG